MSNIVEHSIEVIWDGLSGYEAYQDTYDYYGDELNISGIDYYLIKFLCQGDRFCHFSEALVKKAFELASSPSSNSLYDASVYHPLSGSSTIEIRNFTKSTSVSYSSEIGGGGRSATNKTALNGGKTHIKAHIRTLHKLNNTTFFAFVDIKFSPRIRIIIVRSDALIRLWKEGIFGYHKVCKDGKKRFLLPQSFGRKKLYTMLYGNSDPNKLNVWLPKNPFGITKERMRDNIEVFNNEKGYDYKINSLGIKPDKKQEIDGDILKNIDDYQFYPPVFEISKNKTEIVDMFGFCFE